MRWSCVPWDPIALENSWTGPWMTHVLFLLTAELTWSPLNSIINKLIITIPPGLEKHGCHAMILPWSYHDHGETWLWSCHDDGHAFWHGHHDSRHDHGMITMFCKIHTWSWCDHHVFPVFFLKKNGLFVNVFSNSCCHIPLLAHLTSFRGIHASEVASQQK